MSIISITRRYWWWQHKKMLRDDVGYLRPMESPLDILRPRAIKWIPVNPEPGGLTEIPRGWQLAPYEKWRVAHNH